MTVATAVTTSEGATPHVAGWGQKSLMLAITVIPFMAVCAAVVLLWNSAVSWSDLALLVVLYLCMGLGVTIGYHRMLTHSAFESVPPLKATLLVFGSMALQGAAITWAIDHRTHHAFSDKEGDPHSPHHGFGDGVGGMLRGLVHAHMGWLFTKVSRDDAARYAKDLTDDRMVQFIDRTFVLWAVFGFLLPFVLGGLITQSWLGAFTGLLWGGLVRVFLNHHVTWSVNSICHYFGRRPFATYDHSTNNWLLAIPSLGEAWHHNHHVFPTSAFHGLRRRQIDISGLLIASWEKIGLVRNVRRPTAEQIARKLTARDQRS